MQTTLKKIKTFSKCPRRYWFLQGLHGKPISQDLSIAISVIKKAYIITNDTGFKVKWRKIIGWVNRRVFKNINVKDKEQYNLALKSAEYILKFLHSWYYQVYMENSGVSYVDISIETMINNHLISSILPIVNVDEAPTIVSIGNIEKKEINLSNNIEVCGQMALLSKELEVDEIKYVYIQMKPYGGIQIHSINRNKKQHKRVIEMVNDIAQCIYKKVDYPAVSKQCDSCLFKKRCKL